MKSLFNLKRFRIGRYEQYLLGIIVFATALRFILIYLNWPGMNSDEANMGLVARHIAYNGEWPLFFYGQPYMGPVEAYLAAPLFHLLGPSLFALRLELLLFFILFLAGMYALTALLHTPKFGLFICLLFSFGTTEVIGRQLRAVGEYPETEFFAVAICVITIWLALYAYRMEPSQRTTGARISLYALLGLIIGVSLWVDMLILPFVCMGLLFLLLFCRRECFSWAGVALVLGTLIGLIPLIIYNVSVPFSQNSIAVLLHIHDAGTTVHPSLGQKFIGVFAIGMPGSMGNDISCAQDQFPYFGHTVLSCVVTRLSWSLGYLTLWCIAAGLSLITIWRTWRARAGTSLWHPEWTFEQSRQVIIACGRLMVLICAIGTLFLFATSPAAGLTPGPTARYLTCMLLSIPMVLWPLWDGLGELLIKLKIRAMLSLFVRLAILGLIIFTYVNGTLKLFVYDLPVVRSDYQRQQQTVQNLERLNLDYVYSGYWTCNNLMFLSNEKIMCSVVNDQLGDGYNRYPAFSARVKNASRAGYIFPLGSDADKYLLKLATAKNMPAAYRVIRIPGYHVFVPV